MGMIYNGIAVAPARIDLLSASEAPSALTATADGGYTRIDLAWTDNSADEDGFKIERSPDDAAWAQIDTVGSGLTYCTDTGRTRGKTYYYRVRAFKDSTNSDYTSSANDTVWALTDVTVYADYDPNLEAFEDIGGTDPCEDADGVAVLNDQANSHDLSQSTVGARPTWEDNELNSLPIIRHAAGDVLAAATASDWTFLHNGTEFGVYIVFKTTSANPDAVYLLMDTGSGASTDTGFSVWYDDRASQTREDIITSPIAKGAGGNYEAEAVSTTEAAEGAEWHIVAVRLTSTQLEAWTDGHWGGYDENTPDGAPSASSPTSALVVGGRHDNTLNLVGDWARIIIISGTVSDANHKALQDYLSEVYDLFDNAFFGSESVVEHDASGNDQNGFVGLGQAPNRDLIIGYTKASTHAAHDGDLIIKISSDGGDTWGAEQTIWDYSSDGGGTDEWATPRFTTTGNDIWMAVGQRVSAAAVVDGIGYFISTDNGQSWSGITQLTEATFTALAVEGGGIFILANGDWLYPYYGRDTGDAANRRSCRVLRSQDSGATWSNLATIADGPTDGVDYSEVGLVQVSNGDVIAIIREDTGPTLYRSVSIDDGATWGATSQIADASGLPTPLQLSTGEIISPQRSKETDERAQILFSGDEGASWQLGWRFAVSPNDDSSNNRMTYGQFVEDADGAIYLGYGFEFNNQSTSDVMFVKTS